MGRENDYKDEVVWERVCERQSKPRKAYQIFHTPDFRDWKDLEFSRLQMVKTSFAR